MFDFIPTVGEIFNKIECTLTNHEYVTVTDEKGNYLYRECECCGKRIK